MKNDNPLSPHIQIYNWHISSLVSISHRITGIINFASLTLICFWVSYLVLGKDNYELIFIFLNSFIGKFLILAIVWSFSFQILSEIRHLFWDYGIGFELKTANITGSLVIVGSFTLTLLIYILGKNFLI
jgi:succinate dehydrogenase / fumarate reductase cytochrome b subunit